MERSHSDIPVRIDAAQTLNRFVPPPPKKGIAPADDYEDCLKREEKRKADEINDRIVKAGVPARLLPATLDNFEADTKDKSMVLDTMRTYSSKFGVGIPLPANAVLLYGRPGTGKTHLACAVMRAVAPRFGIRYTTVSWLARKVRSTYHRRAEETEEDILRDHINVSLLTIDEIGVGLGSDHEKAMVHDVIAGRYDAKKPTILLSNLSLEAVLEAIGDRLVDRLREDAGIVLPCAWPSYRGRA